MKNLLNKKEIPSTAKTSYTVVATDTDGKVKTKIVEKGFEYEYVDLGLSVKWATCNLGATKPEEYGKYYQWGDTVGYEGDEAKAHSTWATAPFNNGSSDFNESYFRSNSGTWLTAKGVLSLELKPEYDAVYQATNGKAHMPTQADLQELYDNTTSTWYDSGNTEFNGVAGRKFTSNTNGNSIFIPAAGYAIDGSLDGQGLTSDVWSSSLSALYGILNPRCSMEIFFLNSDMLLNNSDRCDGYSLRGVCK